LSSKDRRRRRVVVARATRVAAPVAVRVGELDLDEHTA
jgi:hypothetical protein